VCRLLDVLSLLRKTAHCFDSDEDHIEIQRNDQPYQQYRGLLRYQEEMKQLFDDHSRKPILIQISLSR
jgi:hypothetical protein